MWVEARDKERDGGGSEKESDRDQNGCETMRLGAAQSSGGAKTQCALTCMNKF